MNKMTVIKRIRSKKITPSIIDWFEQMKTPLAKVLIVEDNTKFERLEILNKKIRLPYNIPIKIKKDEIFGLKSTQKKISNILTTEQYILNLLPKKPNLARIRQKGGYLKNLIRWLKRQNINIDNYDILLVPRCPDVKLAAIFIVSDNEIWGEVVRGGLSQLTRGKFYSSPTIFSFDYKNWKFSKINSKEEQIFLKRAIEKIHVPNHKTREGLKSCLRSSFTKNNYLKGYFEFSVWPKGGINFVDYNRHQAKIFKEFDIQNIIEETGKLWGLCAFPGKATGKVRVIKKSDDTVFNDRDILVCKTIKINYLPLIKKAAAIITENNNLLCHSVVVTRELKKPCIIKVKNATKKLKNGQLVEVDANRGIIKVIK